MTGAEPAAVAGKRIHALDPDVVNQIAAGEVIQRPCSALKELLENSIDAGATQITVTVRDGGLKLIQITDNGGGIHADDLPVLCHRHTTSKLQKYEDLAAIGTLGFRGEALCSISFVSRFSVQTMRAGDELAWRALYRAGELLPPGPEACAGVPGTSIIAEDLFYNVPTRRRALGSPAEEHARIFDVVAKYAVRTTGVGFTLKRQNQPKADIHTLPHFTRLNSIKAIYGAAIANHLRPVSVRASWPDDHGDAPAELPPGPAFSLEGYVSSGDHAPKKTTMLLFINGRAVDCSPLKRALEATYAALYSKASRFWAFLDLRLPAAHVDVNVHPTKSEVAFLHETEVVDAARDAVEALLASGHDARSFSRAAAPSAVKSTPPDAGGAAAMPGDGSTQRAKAGGDHKLIRTDHRSTSLQPFLSSNPLNDQPSAAAIAGSARRRGALKRGFNAVDVAELGADRDARAGGLITHMPNPPLLDDAALRALVDAVEREAHTALTRVVREHTWVGALDGRTALVQSGTRLYMADAQALSCDLMYQQALARCGQFAAIRLEPPPQVAELVQLGLDAKEAAGAWTEADGSKEELAAMVVELLAMKADTLRTRFAVGIEGGRLHTLPRLIESYCPDLDALPEFLLTLAADVEWSEEPACTEGVAQALAELYCIKPGRFRSGAPDAALPAGGGPGSTEVQPATWLTQHVILPAARAHLKVKHTRATDGTVVQVAALEQLYKVFERC